MEMPLFSGNVPSGTGFPREYMSELSRASRKISQRELSRLR